jgi:uncharacterized protein with PIN domain
MMIDASAIVAILNSEADARRLAAAIDAASALDFAHRGL